MGADMLSWRADGKELFFLRHQTATLMAAPVRSDAVRFRAGPQALFLQSGASTLINHASSSIAVTKDGKSIPGDREARCRRASAPLTVVVNWLATVQK